MYWKCLHSQCFAVVHTEYLRDHMYSHYSPSFIDTVSSDDVYKYYKFITADDLDARLSTECTRGHEPVKPTFQLSEHNGGIGVWAIDIRQVPGDNYVVLINHEEKYPIFAHSSGANVWTLQFHPRCPNECEGEIEPRWSIVKIIWPVGKFICALTNQRYSSEFVLARDPNGESEEQWESALRVEEG